MTAFTVIPGTDFTIKVTDGTTPTTVLTTIGGCTGLTIGDGSTAFSDTTDFSTSGFKTYVSGLRSIGNSKVDFNWTKTDAGQVILNAMNADKTLVREFQCRSVITGDTATFNAYVDSLNIAAAGSSDNVLRASFTLVNTTDITWAVT